MTHRRWVIVEAVLTVALVALLIVGLSGHEIRWLGMPYVVWIVWIATIGFFVDRQRLWAKSSASAMREPA